MIVLQPIRTRRICVRPRELTLGEAIAILKIPGQRHELVTTEFLRKVADGATAPSPSHTTDPRLWTVQERTLLVCHYLAQVSEYGPDIPVGEDGRLSDYVLFDSDLKVGEVDIGVVADRSRRIAPLLGAHAEVLERLCKTRGDWIIGAMACQISCHDEPHVAVSEMGEVELIGYIQGRMDEIRGMPESDFEAMLDVYSRASSGGIFHFFMPNFDDFGLVFDVQSQREAGPKNPARFLAVSCINQRTRRLFGANDRAGG